MMAYLKGVFDAGNEEFSFGGKRGQNIGNLLKSYPAKLIPGF